MNLSDLQGRITRRDGAFRLARDIGDLATEELDSRGFTSRFHALHLRSYELIDEGAAIQDELEIRVASLGDIEIDFESSEAGP